MIKGPTKAPAVEPPRIPASPVSVSSAGDGTLFRHGSKPVKPCDNKANESIREIVRQYGKDLLTLGD